MTEPKTELLKDHAEMEHLLSLLSQAVASNDECQDLRGIWARVESLIVDHIQTEEREFFPLVASVHLAEVEELRADHGYIRENLARLGVELELHSLRKPEIDEFVAFLRRHAEQENQTLYHWLAERPDRSVQNIVQHMLAHRPQRGDGQTAS